MSSNTVVPGMAGHPSMPNAASPMGIGQQPFSQPINGTIMPGVNPMPGAVVPKGQVLGFLYSVSKTMAGEYWPLYLGANTIGRGQQNNIILQEGTVSDNHACIHIISRGGKLVVYISDTSSKTGTLLNGELLRGEPDLKNGDLITVGEHYTLFVVLINPAELGLSECPEFVASASPSMPQFSGMPQGAFPHEPLQQRQSQGPRSYATVIEGQSGAAPVGGHTVIMDSGEMQK